MTLGDRIRIKRKESNMTQDELGKRIGVQKSAIHKYESDMLGSIPLARLQRIADVLDTDISYFLPEGEESDAAVVDARDQLTEKLIRCITDKMSAEQREDLWKFGKYMYGWD